MSIADNPFVAGPQKKLKLRLHPDAPDKVEIYCDEPIHHMATLHSEILDFIIGRYGDDLDKGDLDGREVELTIIGRVV